jgi:hypothetical protein
MKASFIFEPVVAPFISYYLKRPLIDWEEGRKAQVSNLKS